MIDVRSALHGMVSRGMESVMHFSNIYSKASSHSKIIILISLCFSEFKQIANIHINPPNVALFDIKLFKFNF